MAEWSKANIPLKYCFMTKIGSCCVSDNIYAQGENEIHCLCRHLIPAPNAWAARAQCTTRRSIATLFSEHGCTDDLRNKRSIDLQATWGIDVLGIFFDRLCMGCFYNQTLSGVRSTGAGLRCLCCK